MKLAVALAVALVLATGFATYFFLDATGAKIRSLEGVQTELGIARLERDAERRERLHGNQTK